MPIGKIAMPATAGAYSGFSEATIANGNSQKQLIDVANRVTRPWLDQSRARR